MGGGGVGDNPLQDPYRYLQLSGIMILKLLFYMLNLVSKFEAFFERGVILQMYRSFNFEI